MIVLGRPTCIGMREDIGLIAAFLASMKPAGLQEKSSLEVDGYVEYNGAASARRSLLGGGEGGGGDVTSGIYRGGGRLGRRSAILGRMTGPTGNDPQLTLTDGMRRPVSSGMR
jgi:hypothetical protein